MKLMVLNGPNINMIGIREKELYGTLDSKSICLEIEKYAKENNIIIDIRQSNYEGDLVTWIQEAYFKNFDGIIINPGAYTHTSIAIADAIKAIAPIPVIEIHLSDISTREQFRHISYPALYCKKQIKGFGYKGYMMAIDEFLKV